MSTVLFLIIVELIKTTICYNLRKTCPAIPEKTRLPFQCETVTGYREEGISNVSCNPNGNYPYLLSCQQHSARINNSCIVATDTTNAICCNQVIEDWHFEYQTAAVCPDDHQVTGCYLGCIDYDNNRCEECVDAEPIAECQQIPYHQQLHCITTQSSSICPGNYTMTFCDTGTVTYDGTNGQCSQDYNVAHCCALYKLEAFNPNPKYVIIDTKYTQDSADEQCMDTYGTHGAAIHTQQDFIQAFDLCAETGVGSGTTYCCLGGSDVETDGVWKWNDGSGTFPPELKWPQGGLWKGGVDPQPSFNATGQDYGCIFYNPAFHSYGYGIHDCYNNTNENNQYKCYPLCNAPSETETRRRLQSDVLSDDLCFSLEITMSVENILPDPSYVLPQTNIDVINQALQQTLHENNINLFVINTNNTLQRRRMLQSNDEIDIANYCPHESENSIKSFQFNSIAYNVSCDNQTLIINNQTTQDSVMSFQWEFSTEDSIVYTWKMDKVLSFIKTNCLGNHMQINIMDLNETLLGESNSMSFFSETIHEFAFNQTIILNSNTTYLLRINIQKVDECAGGIFIFDSVQLTPLLLTVAEPSSCELGTHLAVDTSIQFGLDVFCNSNVSDTDTRQIFETMLYQTHSSDQIIAGEKWDALPNVNSGLRRLFQYGEGGGNCGTFCSSLDVRFADGTSRTILDDDAFPCYAQCIAVDDDTMRVFAVGGQENGAAMDRLAMYKIDSKNSGYLIRENYTNLTLDKARAATMCAYYKNMNKEYIMVINGVAETSDLDLENTDSWFNDIVFIALDEEERNDRKLPGIKLKYNVIDSRPFVTDRNELYLFGGRNGINATNYIQVIDLDAVFDEAVNENDEFATYDRMEGMQSNRVIPFVDFIIFQNQSCILVVGGQDYINKKWIDTQIPLVGLQLYCNNILATNTNTRRRMVQNEETVEFTEFDMDNLQNNNNNNDTTKIIITEYNFTNDDILYEFTTSFELCFELQNDFKKAVDLLQNNITNLEANILQESSKNYRGWSYGFGAVNILNINLFTRNKSVSPTIVPSNEPTASPLRIYPSLINTTNIPSMTPTKQPTDDGVDTVAMILIIVFSIIGAIIIAIIIYYICKKIKNSQIPYIRALDTDDDTEDDF